MLASSLTICWLYFESSANEGGGAIVKEERDAFAAASAIASPSACGREAAFELELELAFEIELTLAAAAAAAAGGDTRAAYSAL